MSDDQRDVSAMRRKAGVGRPPPEIGRVTAATALRVAVAQAAEDVAALMALAAGVQEQRVVLDSLVEGLPEHALLVLIEGPNSRYGLIVVDPQTLAALVEIQTTGRVVPNPAAPRAPTRTDAIMAADFIDRMLELFEEVVEEAELSILAAISGFRYAMPMSDTRAVLMALEDIPYRQFTLTMDLGSGAKEGSMQLVFPFDPPRLRVDRGDTAGGTETLADAVMDTKAEMTAVLHRREMPLAAVTALTVGALVPVPREALVNVRLEDVTGREISLGRLGQVGGHRAVRISEENAETPGATNMVPGVMETGTAANHGGLDAVGDPGALGSLGGMADDNTMAGLGEAGGLGSLGDLGALGGLGDPADMGVMADLGDLGGLEGLGADPAPIGDLPDLDIAPMAIGDLPEPVG